MANLDVATLSVRVTLEGEAQAVRGLNNVASAGAKTESVAKSNKLAFDSMNASMKDFARAGASASQIAQLTGASLQSAGKAVKEYGATVAKGEYDTRGLKAAQEQMALAGLRAGESFKQNAQAVNNVAAAAKNAGAGINSLRGPLTTMTAQMLNLNPAAASAASVLGNFSLGAGPMIGVLAGVAALGYAWNKLTEDARKAKEESKKLLEVLDSLVEREKYSVENSYAANVKLLEGLLNQRAAVEKQRADLKAARGGSEGGLVALGFTGKLSDLDKEIAKVKERVVAGTKKIEDDVRDITREAAEERTRILERELAKRKQLMEEYAREAKEREERAFEDAQRQALFNSVNGRGVPGVAGPVRMGGSLTYSPSVVDVSGQIDASANRIKKSLELQNKLMTEGVQLALQLAGAFGLMSNNAGRGIAGAAGVLSGVASGSPAGIVGGAVGIVDMIRSQRETSKQMQLAVEQFRASVNDWAAENAGAGASSVAGLNSRRQAAFAQIGLSLSDVARIRAANPENYGGGGRAVIESQKAAIAQVEALFADTFAKLIADFRGTIGEALNATLGPQGEYLNQQNAIQKAYTENIEKARALGATQQDLSDIEEIRTRQLAALTNELEKAASSGLLGRFSSLTGSSLNTGPAFLGDSKNGPWFDMFSSFLDGIEAMQKAAESAAFYAQFETQIAQQQLEVSKNALSTQQDLVNNTRQTYEALKRYSDSLSLGTYSPLSPFERLGEARNQYNAIKSLASGGDKSALSSLPETANTYLDALRGYYASSSGYQGGFSDVKSFVDSITSQYGTQLTAEEKMLAELQKQTALLDKIQGTGESTLVQQLIQRANDKPGEIQQISAMLKRLGYQFGFTSTDIGNGNATLGGPYSAIPIGPGNQNGQGNTGLDSTIYNPGYQAYVDAGGSLSYVDWLAGGQPSSGADNASATVLMQGFAMLSNQIQILGDVIRTQG